MHAVGVWRTSPLAPPRFEKVKLKPPPSGSRRSICSRLSRNCVLIWSCVSSHLPLAAVQASLISMRLLSTLPGFSSGSNDTPPVSAAGFTVDVGAPKPWQLLVPCCGGAGLRAAWGDAELQRASCDPANVTYSSLSFSCSSLLPLSNCPQLQCCRHIVPGPLWCS